MEGDRACRRMLEAPGPAWGGDAAARGHERLGRQLADFLLGAQVVAADQAVALRPGARGHLEGQLVSPLLRRDAQPIRVRLRLRRRRRSWHAYCAGTGPPAGPLREGEFFRIDLAGRVRALPGFRGLARADHPGWAPTPPGRRVRLRHALSGIPALPLIWTVLRAAARRLWRRRDLSTLPGVTWRLGRLDADGGEIALEAYDAGGIYDLHLNGEGASFPPQVPGNYYADAYAAYAFAWQFRRTGRREYLDAARAALAFVQRVYPQYRPAAVVWHHSDFKHAPFVETVETLLTGPDDLDGETRDRARELVARFQEDRYEPTNVFALRFHAYAARTGAGLGADGAALTRCLARLAADQTADGLFHDNLPAYPDAHDLTYHQYTLASLAQGLAWRADPGARRLFLRGADLSLGLTSPDGEIAYVGRGANNVYPVASAVLTFETAGAMAALGTADEARPGGPFRRAARLCRTALERWLAPDGMLPTAMNPGVEQRVGWHHCETPYNALAAAFLVKASRVAATTVAEAPLPLDVPGHRRVFDDAGYAAARDRDLYLVVFSGCAQSYAWGGRHRAGLAGLALLGVPGLGALLPILDHPMPDGAPPMTDLPVLNGAAPYGRGRLRVGPGAAPGIGLEHAYGGVRLDRLYLPAGPVVLVVTRVRPTAGRPFRARGLAGLAARVGHGWSVWPEGGQVRLSGPGVTMTMALLLAEPALSAIPRLSRPWTNPRGRAVRVDLADARFRRAPAALVVCHALQVAWEGTGAPRVAPPAARARSLDARRIELVTGDLTAVVHLGDRLEAEVRPAGGRPLGPAP